MFVTKLQKQNIPSWLIDSLFLCVFIGALFFLMGGTRALLAPDEGRYSEIAREMVATGNYLTPYLNGIKYFEKPILFYWLGAASIKVFGPTIWAMRSINLALGLFGCLLTYFVARHLYDRATGILAATILATSALYFVMSHMVGLDLPVTVFLSASLYAFLLAMLEPIDKKRRNYIWFSACASALAVLTKGLIGLVFPMMIIGPWLLLMNEWQLLKKLYLPSGIIIFLLIAVPWHVLVNKANPEFFNFYFITQHILRYTDVDVGHTETLWFFLPILFLGFFPWIVFLPQTIAASLPRAWHERHAYKKEIFLLLWASLIFIFFSFSKSKLMPYILPVIPPLAILTARYLRLANKIRLPLAALILLSAVITYYFYYFTHHTLLTNNIIATRLLLSAGGILFCGFIVAYILNLPKAIYVLAVTMGLFLLTTLAAIPAVDTRTVLPFAQRLQAISKPEDMIVTYNVYYQDLPFYLQRHVSILNWRNELTFGMQYQKADWMIDDAAFLHAWNSPKRVYVVMSKEDFAKFQHLHLSKRIRVIGETVTNLLLTNTPSAQIRHTA